MQPPTRVCLVVERLELRDAKLELGRHSEGGRLQNQRPASSREHQHGNVDCTDLTSAQNKDRQMHMMTEMIKQTVEKRTFAQIDRLLQDIVLELVVDLHARAHVAKHALQLTGVLVATSRLEPRNGTSGWRDVENKANARNRRQRFEARSES
jgi:hypothetical protein